VAGRRWIGPQLNLIRTGIPCHGPNCLKVNVSPDEVRVRGKGAGVPLSRVLARTELCAFPGETVIRIRSHLYRKEYMY